jgi:hypothetical protein
MSLCARKARHLNVGEGVLVGIISGPTLNVVDAGAVIIPMRFQKGCNTRSEQIETV